MHWSDFLHPERVARTIFRLFLWTLVVIIVGSELTQAFARVQLPPGEGFTVMLGLGLVSIAAYVIREHRKREHPSPRSTRGAERTPLLPHMEEDG